MLYYYKLKINLFKILILKILEFPIKLKNKRNINILTNSTKYSIIKIDVFIFQICIIRSDINMSTIDKLIEKMKRQPNGIRFQELARVLEYNGYVMKTKTRNFT